MELNCNLADAANVLSGDAVTERAIRVRIAVLALALLIAGSAPLRAQTTETGSSDVLRDVLLTIPAAAKAGFGVFVLASSFTIDLDAVSTLEFVGSLTVSAILATTNIALIVGAWSDRPEATQLLRRLNFWTEAALLTVGLGILTANFIEFGDFPGLFLGAMLPLAATLGALMFVDTIPFSTELHAEVRAHASVRSGKPEITLSLSVPI